MSDTVKLRALRDLMSEGKPVKSGSVFATTDGAALQALAFGLAEAVEDEKPKPQAKRGTTKKAS